MRREPGRNCSSELYVVGVGKTPKENGFEGRGGKRNRREEQFSRGVTAKKINWGFQSKICGEKKG